MYRNVIYRCGEDATIPWNGEILLSTWNEEGKPVDLVIPHESHLYILAKDEEDTNTKYTTITKKPLKKLTFPSVIIRKKWIDEHPTEKIYDCQEPIIEFLHKTFWKINQNKDFAEYPLKVYSWDIETAVSEGFPDCNAPRDPITVLSLSDINSYETWTWVFLGGDWKKDLTAKNFPNREKQTFFVFESESEMYYHFLSWFGKNRPDIITGWNIDHFDIPYTINRMSELCSVADIAQAFSPIGLMRKKFIKAAVKSMGYDSYRFEGLTVLDYMQLYRDKFCKDSMVIDFKLETVCQEELGVGKLHYDGTFKQFYLRDFKTFVEYNITDVIRLNDLENKKKLIQMTRAMCNESLVSYDKILAAQPIVIGALNLIARRQGQLMMSDDRVDLEYKWRSFEGAYVYAKNDSKCTCLTSFDLNSLYPNIIRTINISPETKVGKIEGYNTDTWTVTINGKTKTMPKSAFINKFGNKLNVSPNGMLFLKAELKEGICATYEKYYYFGRKETKKQMIEQEKLAAELLQKIKDTEDPNFNDEDSQLPCDTPLKKEWKKIHAYADYLNNLQTVKKLNLNSLYGLFSSKYSPICDVDCGEAITSSGRVIIQESMKFVNKYLNEINGEKSDETDWLMLGDTDSLYADVSQIVKKTLGKIPDKWTVSQTNKVCNVIDNTLTKAINDNCKVIAKKCFLSNDCYIEFKREKFCSHALVCAKKNYMLRVLNNEGVNEVKWVSKGIQIKKSALPFKIKEALRIAVESGLIENWTSAQFRDYACEVFNDMKNWDYLDFTKSLGYNTEKVFRKPFDKTGVSSAPAIAVNYYNDLIKELKLTKKYYPIRVGDRFRQICIKPNNPWHIDYIAFTEKFPEEFKKYLEIDYQACFEKFFLKPLDHFMKIFKWNTPDVGKQIKYSIDDL